MSVLNLLQKVKVQTLSFEKHPCKDQDQEVMIHYLNGLALLSQEDQTICDMEKEYLEILINSFGLSDDMLESITDFAMNPNEKQILDMMQSFMGKEIKYNFIMDAMMIAMKDGDFDDAEKEVIRQFGEMFKLTTQEMEDLHKLFELFHVQDGNGLYRYFRKNKNRYMKEENFTYLVDYYEIDFDFELQEEEKKLLTFEFFKPNFEKGRLGGGATEIMTKPVNHAQFCIYLNHAFLEKHIELDEHGKVVDSKSKALLMDLDHSAIAFKDGEFTVNSAKDDEKKVTGVTYVIAEMFIDMISELNGEKYKLSSFTSSTINMKSFVYPIFSEYYFGLRDSYKGYYYAREKYCGNPTGNFFYNSQGLAYDIKASSLTLSSDISFRMMKLPENEK